MSLLSWLGLTGGGEPLREGDTAPDVTARDEHGQPKRLSEFYQTAYTLVYFYPMADSPGCTMQACSLRDGFDELQALGVTIVGVSADAPESQLKFQEKHHLPFTLLADPDRNVAQAFGVPTLLGMTSRQSFIVHDRRIVWRDLRASTRWQARDVLDALKKLGVTGPSTTSA